MPTLLLTGNDIRDLLSMEETLAAVERAFKEMASGKGKMPPKAYLVLERGDFRAMPAALPGAAGMKWVNVHPQNPAQGLPTVMAILIYNDPLTGYPLAIMDATEITAYRTGAAAAIASRYLARKDSQILGIIGAGQQAHTQLLAHLEIFDFKQIRVFDLSEEATEKFIASFPGYPVRRCSLEETAASDILCTLTPSRTPIVKREWIKPGTHINAVGADAKGKEELEPSLLKTAIVVVDDLVQASAAGEINVPVSRGLFSRDDIHATLGEIITGRKPGRKDERAITIFDSTGVAIEDIAVARFLYEKASQTGKYLSVDFIPGNYP
ncbi:MAG: ornithine cyclodeaminase family protein [Dehalococcoidales bacterium]|nr:ornithine cyclodeaminase family protein [Dehalococcoidales bacterium]